MLLLYLPDIFSSGNDSMGFRRSPCRTHMTVSSLASYHQAQLTHSREDSRRPFPRGTSPGSCTGNDVTGVLVFLTTVMSPLATPQGYRTSADNSKRHSTVGFNSVGPAQVHIVDPSARIGNDFRHLIGVVLKSDCECKLMQRRCQSNEGGLLHIVN